MPATPPKSSRGLHRINNMSSAAMECRLRPHSQIRKCSPLALAGGAPESAARDHSHTVGPNQCCSAMMQAIDAPVDAVWAVVRRFDQPQAYKHFLKSCSVVAGGDNSVGALREVRVVSGLPAISSTERLEIMDDDRHVMSFSIVGGDHRLANYRSVTTLHASLAAAGGTVVVESYVVDIPQGNSWEDTRVFVDTIVRCNLQSLAQMVEASSKGSSSP